MCARLASARSCRLSSRQRDLCPRPIHHSLSGILALQSRPYRLLPCRCVRLHQHPLRHCVRLRSLPLQLLEHRRVGPVARPWHPAPWAHCVPKRHVPICAYVAAAASLRRHDSWDLSRRQTRQTLASWLSDDAALWSGVEHPPLLQQLQT